MRKELLTLTEYEQTLERIKAERADAARPEQLKQFLNKIGGK